MASLLLNRSFFYFSHLVTFSWIGLPLLNQRVGVIPVMAMLVPVWVSSTVLWSEREESYGFLRTLPVTDREIVHTKFTMAGLAVLIYFLLMTMATVQFCGGSPLLAYNMALVEIGTVLSLIAAACWFIGMWLFGVGVMIVVVLIFMFLGVAGAILFRFGNGSGPWCAAHELFFVELLAEAPWYVDGLFLLMGLFGYYGLSRLAIKVKRASEPDS
jgi:hypothetical protein